MVGGFFKNSILYLHHDPFFPILIDCHVDKMSQSKVCMHTHVHKHTICQARPK